MEDVRRGLECDSATSSYGLDRWSATVAVGVASDLRGGHIAQAGVAVEILDLQGADEYEMRLMII